jgi:hypothetical protein
MYIARVLKGLETADGDGVRLTRMIGTQQCDMIDPFLMLDRFDNNDPNAYVGGFPDHPHRGFETVTVMLDGRLRHKDSTGGAGVIGPGDVQWMTAGHGIIHSEMPEQIEGRMRGFQLWVNLPAADKMTPAGYQDLTQDKIPTVDGDGLSVHVIAGTYRDITGPAKTATAIRLLRINAEPNAKITISIPAGQNAFFCVYEGQVTGVSDQGTDSPVIAPSLAQLGGSGTVEVTAGPDGAALFYGEGTPINEPVARYGPFVMNTRDELVQAVEDFQNGRLAE